MVSQSTILAASVALVIGTTSTTAFSPIAAVPTSATAASSSTQLHFGIPTFGAGKNDDQEDKKKNANAEPEKKIGFSGLAQLITAGMGSPFLGDFEGVDKETGNFMFSLEANNLVDEVSLSCFLYDIKVDTNVKKKGWSYF